MWIATRPTSPSPVRLHLDVEEDIAPSLGSNLAISPDGGHIAYVALSTTAERELMIRSLDQQESTSLVAGAETTAALDQPFFSPDGQWVGFTTDRGLKKVPVTGGTPVSITEGRRGRGADWGPGDLIVFTPDDTSGLFLVPASGGEPEPLTELVEGETTHRWPQFLPGGDAVLFTSHVSGADDNFDTATIEVVDLDSGQRTVVQRNGSDGRYVPTGHLVYVNGGTLFARPFEVSGPATGSAIPMVDDVSTLSRSGGAEFAFSEDGVLVYREGIEEARDATRPVWVNRDGAAEAIETLPTGATTPRLSPNGQSVLVEVENDLWIYELATGRSRRITRDGVSQRGAWNRMNSSLAYTSGRWGYEQAWLEPSDGSGERRRLTDLDGGSVHVDNWSPDGRILALHQHAEDQVNLLLLAVGEANAEPELIFEDGVRRVDRRVDVVFSPDGRYLAYVSGETGRREVYIRSYPEPGAQHPVSVGGGQQPVWTPNGELFYRDLSGERMMVVSVTTEPRLTVGVPRQLFQGSYVNTTADGSLRPQYDVTPDGQRFLMLLPQPDSELEEDDAAPERPKINVVLNWFDELKRRVPTGR